MTRCELLTLCLRYEDAVEDSPFESSAVLRHKSNRKWFALVFERDEQLCVNLKSDPMEADFLRRVYPAVTPAWHMNKRHWNTISVNSALPKSALCAMIDESFRLTAPKHRAPPQSDSLQHFDEKSE